MLKLNVEMILSTKKFKHDTVYYYDGPDETENPLIEFYGEIELSELDYHILYDSNILKNKIIDIRIRVINAVFNLIESAHQYQPIGLDIINGGEGVERFKSAIDNLRDILYENCALVYKTIKEIEALLLYKFSPAD